MSISNDLRQAVLQAAIQGKLTKQLPEDGCAKDLLEQIKAEKAKLIKEGKLKKEKPLPDITEDEKPFDIPENWEWCRLGEVASIFGGKRIPAGRTLTTEDTGHKYIRVSDMKNESIITDGLMFVPEDIFPTISRYIINKEDVYITVAGTIGRVGKIPVELDGANLTENADRIVFKKINQDWLIKCLGSMVVQCQILDVTTKVGQPKLAIKRIQELIIPIPPFAEQKRIVAKVEELMARIDELEKTEKELEALKKAFPADMKASLLQAAMQGKLTEQLSEDGSAKDLIEQIKAEKVKLIKEGKIKKEKPLPEITEDEKPFDIPENWEWCRIDDVVKKNIKRGKSPTYATQGSVLVFAQKCNVKTGGINLELAQYLDESKLSKYPDEEFMEDEDIVVNSTGRGTLGRVGLFSNTGNSIRVVPDSHVTVIRSIKGVYSRYLYYLLKSYQKNLEGMGDGSTNQTELKPLVLRMAILPLPPLAEQKRIVEKLEKLLPLCDGLK